MSGIQISGLASGINWTSIINELVQADSVGLNQVQAQQNTVNSQVTAVTSLATDLTNLSNAVYTLEDPQTYSGVTAASTTSGSTWTVSADQGTSPGNYAIDVTHVASSAQWNGAAGVSSPLSSTSDVNGLTLATLPTAQAVTAGTFTIDGHQITVTTSESLQDVFTAIGSATSGNVTASYDPTSDTVNLKSADHSPIVLGADNDTSNLLSALELANNGTDSVTSASALGALQLGNTLSNANLKTAITGTDSSGNGSFAINGVTIDYNVNSDTLNTLIGRIDNSGAGVSAAYDANNNSLVLTNTSTGDSGISVSDLAGGNLASALGLTSTAGATLTRGANATFTVNGGPTQVSASNTLSATALGVPGLSVTVNTTGTQTIQVTANSTPVQTAIQTFITNFNQIQTDIQNDTQVTVNNGSVNTSILSNEYEVGDWATSLQNTAFSAGNTVGGAIASLDDLGIDFNGTTGQLIVSDSAKLTQALTQNPQAVANFFQTGTTGFSAQMNSAINDILSQATSEQSNLQNQASALGDQITTMQAQISAQQANLESEFQAMETMISSIQSEDGILTSLYSGGTSTGTSSSNLSSAVNNSVASSSSSSSTNSSTTAGSGAITA
jgi:flagellar hook-associated protein 2